MSDLDTSTDRSPRHFRAVRARAVQLGDQEGAELAGAALRAANLEKAIRAVVDQAPPLSEVQRARLAALLLGGHRADASVAA